MRAVVCVIVALAAGMCAKPNGYIVNEVNEIGYKIIYQSRPWQEAKAICEQQEGKLAVPKSMEEFNFIQKLVRGMHYPNVTGTDYKLLAWLGINNLEDYRVWKNVDGENIQDTGFHTWSGQYNGDGYSDNPAEPHCVGIDAINPGLRDYWCHRPQPFVCQKTVSS